MVIDMPRLLGVLGAEELSRGSISISLRQRGLSMTITWT